MVKKVVLISPDFFNLSTIIKDEIEKNGYECKWFDDRPSKKTIDKILLRISLKLEKGKINRYFNSIIEYCKQEKPSKLIVIIGQCFSVKHYKLLKEACPDIELVFYNWDSIANFPITKDNFTFFDRAYSFDLTDCKKYDIPFLPLFYSYEKEKGVEDLDYSVIVTVKKGKYADLHNITSQLDEKYQNKFSHLYLQSKSLYRYYKMSDKTFKKAKKDEFTYDRLDPKKVEEVFNRSKMVVDIVMAKQAGLTIRTIDTLHLKKKLITNNENIKEYPFYTPQNILVCKDGDKIDFDSDFFTKPFDENHSVDESYSLQSFVKKLLGE